VYPTGGSTIWNVKHPNTPHGWHIENVVGISFEQIDGAAESRRKLVGQALSPTAGLRQLLGMQVAVNNPRAGKHQHQRH
jgi:hypothetical protein